MCFDSAVVFIETYSSLSNDDKPVPRSAGTVQEIDGRSLAHSDLILLGAHY